MSRLRISLVAAQPTHDSTGILPCGGERKTAFASIPKAHLALPFDRDEPGFCQLLDQHLKIFLQPGGLDVVLFKERTVDGLQAAVPLYQPPDSSPD